MKEVIKKNKVSLITGIIAFILGGGLTQLTNSCIKVSDEVQEWYAVISQPSQPTLHHWDNINVDKNYEEQEASKK